MRQLDSENPSGPVNEGVVETIQGNDLKVVRETCLDGFTAPCTNAFRQTMYRGVP
ncbi:MAG: hypothetical protein OXQ84_15405 [bacterium]|nr:hypothetical protein [bacterium]